jgi:hypothetical protein
MTSYKALAQRSPGWAKQGGYVLIFLALFIAGLWHGSTRGFAIFGALQGLGAAVSQIYGDALKAVLGRAGFHAYLQNRWIRAVAIVITFHFFAFTLLFFSGFFEREVEIVQAISSRHMWGKELSGLAGQPMAAAAAACAAAAAIVGWWKQQSIIRRYDAFCRRVSDSAGLLYVMLFLQTTAIIVMFFAFWGIEQKDPLVVYMGF